MPEIGGIFTAFDISASALRAERARMNMHANNVANANTIHDRDGQNNPYRRQQIFFKPGSPTMTGSEVLGVDVEKVETDYDTELQKRYMPGHPDADAQGYVKYPNVSVPLEMVDMMVAQRAFEANLAAFESAKTIFNGALRIIA